MWPPGRGLPKFYFCFLCRFILIRNSNFCLNLSAELLRKVFADNGNHILSLVASKLCKSNTQGKRHDGSRIGQFSPKSAARLPLQWRDVLTFWLTFIFLFDSVTRQTLRFRCKFFQTPPFDYIVSPNHGESRPFFWRGNVLPTLKNPPRCFLSPASERLAGV